VVAFPLELSDSDLAADGNVSVYLQFGARPDFLLKQAVFIVGMENGSQQQAGSPIMLILGVVIVVLLAALIALSFKKKKK
jgi:LPXTG-motif cell wall-anchored protein